MRKKKKGKFSKSWLHQHINDPFVKLARRDGYRARAAFKLTEIIDDEKIMRPGDIIVDLGATPGSWSQVAAERLRDAQGKLSGRIIALDLLPMTPLDGVEFIQGDFREEGTLLKLQETLQDQKADIVMSDMAPNLTGIAAADAAAVGYLCELALDFALSHLKPDGTLIVKSFHGSGFSQIVQLYKQHFKRVTETKPLASRDKSAETFLCARHLKQS